MTLMTFELSFDGELKVEEAVSRRGTAYVVTKEGNNRIYWRNYMCSRNLALERPEIKLYKQPLAG